MRVVAADNPFARDEITTPPLLRFTATLSISLPYKNHAVTPHPSSDYHPLYRPLLTNNAGALC